MYGTAYIEHKSQYMCSSTAVSCAVYVLLCWRYMCGEVLRVLISNPNLCIPLFLHLLVPRFLTRYHEYVGSSSGDMRSMIQGVFTVPALFAEKAVGLIVNHFSGGKKEHIVVPTAESDGGTWDIFDESQCST